MITRNTKTKATNRQRQEAARSYTPEMLKGAKYDHFKFNGEWLAECERQPTKGHSMALYDAIVFYGLNEMEPNPENLTPEAQKYFNREIRPELDRQHKRLNEGKKL